MQNGLVSIISPCYNVGPYIGRFLDSLIAQTYKNLEIILVNDGATDNTGEIIKSYIPRLESEGYKVSYIEQENGGQSSAVNNALKRVTGKYLTWPDPDDWLTPDSIEKRVAFMTEHPDAGLVRCNATLINEETDQAIRLFEPATQKTEQIKDFFNKLVFTRTWFGAMCCMIRMDFFDSVVPNREIYVEKKAGQNWQMMLPIAHKYPCWQMSDVLAYYLIRKNSHSHSNDTFERAVSYSDICENVLLATLTKLKISDKIISQMRAKYAVERFRYSCQHASIKQRFYYFKQAVKRLSSPYKKLILICNLVLPFSVSNIISKVVYKLKHEK